MSNDNKAAKPEPKPKVPFHVEKKLDEIPVSYILAPGGAPFNVPGKVSGSSVTTNPERPKNRDHHYITYLPVMRMFAVYWCRANEEPRCVYVPDVGVAQWEAL